MDIKLDAPKTKSYIKMLEGLKLSDKKTLLLTSGVETNVVLSARNFPKAKVMTAENVSTYDIMNASVILLCEGAMAKINEILK